jgi:flavin reductase
MPRRRLCMIPAMATGDALRELMRSFPHGVAVATVDAQGQRVGLTLSSLVTLSLDPPLVGFTVSREAALHELLRGADAFGLSLLAGDQDGLAQHFARGVPPIAMWHGVDVQTGSTGAPLLAGALGWLECRRHSEIAVGTHTLFVGEVEAVERGEARSALVRLGGSYRVL